MIEVEFLHPRATWDHVGMIPEWLSERDPRPATQQLDAAYRHGGGWSPFHGFTLLSDGCIEYQGDPVLRPIARMRLRKELILMYEHSWVAVIQPNRSFEICRMD